MKVGIKKLNPEAIIPQYAHEGDSGMDVHSTEDLILKPRERAAIHTGLAFELPKGYEIQTRPKSGPALKHGISIVNTPGTLDSGYRGELMFILINHGNEPYEIKKGQKVAQIVVQKVEEVEFEEKEEFSETSRGKEGFGSTGLF